MQFCSLRNRNCNLKIGNLKEKPPLMIEPTDIIYCYIVMEYQQMAMFEIGCVLAIIYFILIIYWQ